MKSIRENDGHWPAPDRSCPRDNAVMQLGVNVFRRPYLSPGRRQRRIPAVARLAGKGQPLVRGRPLLADPVRVHGRGTVRDPATERAAPLPELKQV
jgi:hypothetical protein